jgi:hypothetical protein
VSDSTLNTKVNGRTYRTFRVANLMATEVFEGNNPAPVDWISMTVPPDFIDSDLPAFHQANIDILEDRRAAVAEA